MAEVGPSKFGSVAKSSDVLPDIYCNPCYEVDGDILEAVGFCQDCVEFLCTVCFASHRKVKQTRSHQLLEKTKMPTVKPKARPQKFNCENCIHHQNEDIDAYCKSCDQLCCKICLTIQHHSCKIEKLSTISVNVEHSVELKVLNKKLEKLKKGFIDNHSKAENYVIDINNFHTEAIIDMRKIQEEVAKLLVETEKQAEIVKAEDLQTVENISSTCEILEEQIDNIKSSLQKKQEHEKDQAIFIAMKRAENQVNTLEDRLRQLKTDNKIHQYKFEPDNKLKTLLNKCKVLGKLSFSKGKKFARPEVNKPIHVAGIDMQASYITSFELLPNQQLLLVDHTNSMLNLIDMKQNTLLAKHNLPDFVYDITEVNNEEFAVTSTVARKVIFLKVTSKSISKIRDISSHGDCYGIAYNSLDKTLIVTCYNPSKVEILNLTGTVIRSIEKDSNGDGLFKYPCYVALSCDNSTIYVSDAHKHSVTHMTLSGKVNAVYKDDKVTNPGKVCVNNLGTVYLIGCISKLYQICQNSDNLKLVDGFENLFGVTYCAMEDNLYLGQKDGKGIKIFKMN